MENPATKYDRKLVDTSLKYSHIRSCKSLTFKNTYFALMESHIFNKQLHTCHHSLTCT